MKLPSNILVWMATLLLVFSSFSGCQDRRGSEKYPYSWKDFDGKVRELLYKIEQHGIVYIPFSGCRGSGEIYDSAQVYFYDLESTASQKELLKATKCSSPAIRATALAILGSDTLFRMEKLLMEHIFDTAHIFDDYDHRKWTVISFALHNSDYYLKENVKTKLYNEVLKKIPFERAAYVWLTENQKNDTFPGYYATIKKMALFQIHSDFMNWHLGIPALEVLASYQYDADIPLIDSLLDRIDYVSHGQFLAGHVIKIFPAPAFEKYYLDTSQNWVKQFSFLREPNANSYLYKPQNGIETFISLLLAHKSARSARMLELIWDKSPLDQYASLSRYEFELYNRYMKAQIAFGVREQYSEHYKDIVAKTKEFYTTYKGRNIMD